MKNLVLRILIMMIAFSGSHAIAQSLIINEVLSSNLTGICDSTGSKNDWIEIYNPNSYVVNLNDYRLSDDASKPDKWHFPDVNLAPLSYALVFASEEEDIISQMHCNFKLSKEGEILSLYDSHGKLVDQVTIAALDDDISYGRNSIGKGELRYFDVPTPGKANDSHPYKGFVKEQAYLTQASGFYTESITVGAEHEEEDVVLRYTLDGTEPTEQSSILNDEIAINDASFKANYYSLIPTNPSFDYSKLGFDEKRANTRGWLPPYHSIAKSNIFKVRAFKEDYIPSKSVSASYFIFPEGAERYQFPVVSITTDKANLFDDKKGIYVYGTTGLEGNYKESGCEWERPVQVEYFEDDGSFAFKQQMGARIHGGGGRHSTVKNLRLYARDEYGKSILKYDFFDDKENDEFKRILVRGPGHRPDCAPRDDLADLLLQNQDMDIQHLQHVIVFINGEYWGLHTIKERFDQDYLSLKYGKKDDDFVIMKNGGSLDKGEVGDDQHYYDLLDYIKNHDMSLPEHLEYVKTQIDLDNYLSYLAAEIYMGNVDWVITNIKFWRYQGDEKNTSSLNPLDGRWRWFMFDFDLVFGGSCDNINPHVHIMDDVFDPEFGKATTLSCGLKQNAEFERLFVNRLCDQMNSMFTLQNFRKRISEIDSLMTPEMLEHTQRWRYPSVDSTLIDRQYELPSLTQWQNILDSLYNYPTSRKRKTIDHLNASFSLSDTAALTIDVNDKTMGSVKVNSLLIDASLDGVSSAVYPWSGMYFQDLPISLEAIAEPGYRFARWEGVDANGELVELSMEANTSVKAIFELDPNYDKTLPIFINEIMATNKTIIADAYYAYSDWVELYNPNDRAVNLADYYISDDLKAPYKYQFVQDAVIPAKSFQMLWCNDHSERGLWHTNFKLSAEGEAVILSRPDSSLVDFVEFGEQGEDVSYGRHTDGADQWVFFASPLHPTPGVSNDEAADLDETDFRLALYPNPVSRGQHVSLPYYSDYQLYDGRGQSIRKAFNVKTISTEDLVNGFYIVKTKAYGSQKLMVK